MQAHIAQALALTCVGNAYLQGKDVARFWPDASVFRFSKSCDFRQLVGEDDRLIAADPMTWFDQLRGACSGLRLHTEPLSRAPNQTLPVEERMLAGFVGGGPAWIIEAAGASSVQLWQGFDRLGDRKDPQQKIWLNTYLLSGETRPQSATAAGLAIASAELAEALTEIETFAATARPYWTKVFAAARAELTTEMPDIPYHTDIADFAGLTQQQRRVFAACVKGWVFGGMGSWNDNIPSPETADADVRTSERLFRALIAAICALANSTFAG